MKEHDDEKSDKYGRLKENTKGVGGFGRRGEMIPN